MTKSKTTSAEVECETVAKDAQPEATSAADVADVAADVADVAADVATDAAATSVATPPENPPESDLEKAQREAKESQELHLRAVADLENYRRRAEKDMKNAVHYVLDSFCLSVCEVRDCMEAALDSNQGGAEKMREGLELTLRKMESAMERQHLLTVRPDVGVAFDPQLHEAVATQDNPDLPPNSIVEITRAGYTLNSRVLRAASVIVSKKVENKEV